MRRFAHSLLHPFKTSRTARAPHLFLLLLSRGCSLGGTEAAKRGLLFLAAAGCMVDPRSFFSAHNTDSLLCYAPLNPIGLVFFPDSILPVPRFEWFQTSHPYPVNLKRTKPHDLWGFVLFACDHCHGRIFFSIHSAIFFSIFWASFWFSADTEI